MEVSMDQRHNKCTIPVFFFVFFPHIWLLLVVVVVEVVVVVDPCLFISIFRINAFFDLCNLEIIKYL